MPLTQDDLPAHIKVFREIACPIGAIPSTMDVLPDPYHMTRVLFTSPAKIIGLFCPASDFPGVFFFYGYQCEDCRKTILVPDCEDLSKALQHNCKG